MAAAAAPAAVQVFDAVEARREQSSTVQVAE
jgi:hypothetical protein